MRTLTEQAAAVANGEVSPVELTEHALTAAEAVQDKLNAFTVMLADRALDRAKALEGAEAFDPARPLHGVPVAVKDLYDIEGIATTGGCAAYHDRIARTDSHVVDALQRAGAIIVAKTNQHELACGATTQVSSFGPCFNPWGTGRIPGGSSGGSGAAVAAGVVAMAMGSDTGGSIRIPSSFCGVTGLKPTHGAVSLRGAMPMCPSLDTAGPLARSAEDCALVHGALVGFDDGYLWSRSSTPHSSPESLDGMRIGLPATFFAQLHPDSRAAIDAAAKTFESMGAVLKEVDGPDLHECWQLFSMRLSEVAHCYRDLWDDDRVSPSLAALIAFGRSISAADAFGARETTLRTSRTFARALAAVDAVLAPCTPFPAPLASDDQVKIDGVKVDVHAGGPARLTLPVNLAGLPAVSFPVGFSSEELPVGAQLIGPEWSELRLCAIVAAYQETTDWHLRTPS